MGLLLDVGTSGTLRGLSESERDVGTVHLPEDVIPPVDDAAVAARAAMEALLARRRKLAARMIYPTRGHGRPR